jgi:hypothetical protein
LSATIDHRRVAIDNRWVLDILENIGRSASAAPTKCDIRKWPSEAPLREEIIPLRDEQGAYLFLIEITVSPNISRTPTADPREFCRAGRLLERNFQNMQENRLPGERPNRHPAAGIWERTSPRFHRDRSRRDACPTLRPRPENNPVKGQARNLFIPDRHVPPEVQEDGGAGPEFSGRAP